MSISVCLEIVSNTSRILELFYVIITWLASVAFYISGTSKWLKSGVSSITDIIFGGLWVLSFSSTIYHLNVKLQFYSNSTRNLALDAWGTDIIAIWSQDYQAIAVLFASFSFIELKRQAIFYSLPSPLSYFASKQQHNPNCHYQIVFSFFQLLAWFFSVELAFVSFIVYYRRLLSHRNQEQITIDKDRVFDKRTAFRLTILIAVQLLGIVINWSYYYSYFGNWLKDHCWLDGTAEESLIYSATPIGNHRVLGVAIIWLTFHLFLFDLNHLVSDCSNSFLVIPNLWTKVLFSLIGFQNTSISLQLFLIYATISYNLSNCCSCEPNVSNLNQKGTAFSDKLKESFSTSEIVIELGCWLFSSILFVFAFNFVYFHWTPLERDCVLGFILLANTIFILTNQKSIKIGAVGKAISDTSWIVMLSSIFLFLLAIVCFTDDKDDNSILYLVRHQWIVSMERAFLSSNILEAQKQFNYYKLFCSIIVVSGICGALTWNLIQNLHKFSKLQSLSYFNLIFCILLALIPPLINLSFYQSDKCLAQREEHVQIRNHHFNFSISEKLQLELVESALNSSKIISPNRIQHPKQYGCLNAVFSVGNPNIIPAKFQNGIFKKFNQNYSTIVRISQGGSRAESDYTPNVRGFSLKILLENNQTQDLLFGTSKQFFLNDEDIHILPSLLFISTLNSVNGWINWLYSAIVHFGIAPVANILLTAKRMTESGRENTDLLNLEYYSAVPYFLGPSSSELSHLFERNKIKHTAGQIVKYKLSPIDCHTQTLLSTLSSSFVTDSTAEDLLSWQLLNRLGFNTSTAACFGLFLLEQLDPCKHSASNHQLIWDDSTIYQIPVATLTIPAQTDFILKSKAEFCDQLTFTPFNSLDNHRPISIVSTAREIVYSVASESRTKISSTVKNTNNISHFSDAEFVLPYQYYPTGKETFSGPVRQIFESKSIDHGNEQKFTFSQYISGLESYMLPTYLASSFQPHFRWRELFSIITNLCSSFLSLLALPLTHQSVLLHFKKLEDFSVIFNHSVSYFRFPIPASLNDAGNFSVVQQFRTDKYFIDQFLLGPNPMLLSVLNVENFQSLNLDHDLIRANCGMIIEILKNVNMRYKDIDLKFEHDTNQLHCLLKALLLNPSKLFYVDYQLLDGIFTRLNRIVYAPVVLFVLDNSNTLHPLFIQMHQHNNQQLYFPPCKNEKLLQANNLWLFAKMHVLNADSNYHQAISHLYITHLQIEPIIISTLNQLSVDHPIRQLIEPHFDQTLAINELGRKSLLSELHSNLDDGMSIGLKGSLQLMEKFHELAGKYGRFSFLNQTFPNLMKSRGFQITESNQFPHNFIYGEIGQRYWNALQNYIFSCLSRVEAYGDGNQAISFEQIQQDTHLSLWVSEIQTSGAIYSFPDLNSSEVLIETITQIVFLCTFQHTAVSSNLYDAHAFIPGRPTILVKPLPLYIDLNYLVDEMYIISAMPSYSEIQEVLLVSRLLGSSPNLRDICAGLCTSEIVLDNLQNLDEKTLSAIKSIQPSVYFSNYFDFIKQLKLIEQDFGFAKYLKPSRISTSVCI